MQTPTQALESDKLVTHQVNFGGHKLTVANFTVDRLINDSLANDHVWEPWQLNLMSRIIKPNFTCVDVGANVGINAMFAGKLCPQGRVLAYEPFQAIFRVLKHNIEQNGLTNVLPIDKGLSDATTSLEMITDVLSVGGAHVINQRHGGDQYATTTAHFARLDDQMREHGVNRIDFIKIDVEGHEMKVLAGGESYLRHPDLQLAIEFAPIQHFRAAVDKGCFIDRPLFDKVKSWFKHVFVMCRDQTLHPVGDWHLLRRKLMGGFFVDDLYCVNTIRPEVQSMIVKGAEAPPHVQRHQESIGPVSVTYFNRDVDGWGMADDYNPAVVSMTLDGPKGTGLKMVFNPMWRKHVPSGDHYPAWPVWIMAGEEQHRVDLLDSPRELAIQLTGQALHVTVQSEYKTTAREYLGNPADPRQIGFRFELKR